MILTIQNNQISKVNPTNVTLDITELRDLIITDPGSRFMVLSKWKSVTLIYRSSVMENQTKQMKFIMSSPQTVYVNNETLSPHFISELLLTSVTIHDFENGSFTINRDDLPQPALLDVASSSIPTPVSPILSSTNTQSGFVSLLEAAKWEVGFKARLYDVTLGKYLNPVVTIFTVNTSTGLITVTPSVATDIKTLVLASPSGDKHVVTVGNNGSISTEIDNAKALTPGFKLTRKTTGSDYYVIKVQDDGTLYIDHAVLGEQDYPTNDTYTMRSQDLTGWKFNVTSDYKLQTESLVVSLAGLQFRFAYSNEVTLDQLQRFKFD